jgi:4-hydroxybenzoate polyprenyltransferase
MEKQITAEPLSWSVFHSVREWGALVKFSHTIFALPFAMSMLVVVLRDFQITLSQFFWVLACLVTARTAAMAFNRVVDRDIDAENPRTKERHLPAGKIAVKSATTLIVLSGIIFLASSAALGIHCLILAPFVLGILFLYSYTKRFTAFSHIVLGLCLSLAPGGVWYALTATVALLPIYLMLGVLFWVAGFDILYSCQDEEFDRSRSLKSVPAVFGLRNAFFLSLLFHFFTIASFVQFGIAARLGTVYFVSLLLFSVVLISQHFVVRPANLERIDAAFFNRNGIASVLFFLGVLLDVVL